MLIKTLIGFGIIILLFFILFLWCCIRMSAICNTVDIMLYQNDVTVEDCIDIKENYGMSTVVNDGSVLGFIND